MPALSVVPELSRRGQGEGKRNFTGEQLIEEIEGEMEHV